MQTRGHQKQPSTRADLDEELGQMFDRAIAGYYWAIEAEEWSAAFEYRVLLDSIHLVAERVAQ